MQNLNNKNESDYKVLEALNRNPHITQRELAKDLNFSLGKANYVLESLFKRGLVKIDNFRKSGNKKGYVYLLTPKGIKEKIIITRLFLEERMQEYEDIKQEIRILKTKVDED
tara:strand:- start:7373 stop:7708 length:336 start_codon:yes stop_codon:yes gene_type:complete